MPASQESQAGTQVQGLFKDLQDHQFNTKLHYYKQASIHNAQHLATLLGINETY